MKLHSFQLPKIKAWLVFSAVLTTSLAVSAAPLFARTTAPVGTDFDRDGYSKRADCNDRNADIHPGATERWYDGVDQNCDDRSDYDRDGDHHDSDDYGGDDCNDTEFFGSNVYPGANEIHDGMDNDCDGAIDE